MNRELKFRAWHKKWKLVASEIELGSTEANIIVGNTGDVLDINEEYSNLVFMQFTGLHDKNGKEIYEGDVVKSGLFPRKVVYQDCSFWLEKKSGSKTPLWGAPREFEVIGNIYENPELMEQTT